MQPSYDAIIIGCGIIGNCLAFELAKKGYKTLSVDKNGGSGLGSTAGSCAIVRAHYSTFEGVAMAYAGFDIWKNWADYCEGKDSTGMAAYRNSGSLMLKTTGHDWRRVKSHYDSVGVVYAEWDLEAIRRRLPIFDLHRYWPVTRPDTDEHFFDKRNQLLEGGIYSPQVVEIRASDNRVQGITLADGDRIDAPVLINVAGPHSCVINRLAGVEKQNNIKTRPLRHEVCFVPSPPGFDYEHHGMQIADGDNGIYLRPELGNAILIGSEDPACDPKDWVADADRFDRQLTDRQWEAQVYRCARRIPQLPIPNNRQGIVELYDVSDDWIPIYDQSDLEGYYLAIGTSGNQYKNGPVAGMMMAALIDQVENRNLDHDRAPLRFGLPGIDLEINAGFFSRNRPINTDSSYSVNG